MLASMWMMRLLQGVTGIGSSAHPAPAPGEPLLPTTIPNKRKDQVVPEELIARLHTAAMFTGYNTAIGYDLDYMRDSWKEFYGDFDNVNERLRDAFYWEGRRKRAEALVRRGHWCTGEGEGI
jgi:hypothetical protein